MCKCSSSNTFRYIIYLYSLDRQTYCEFKTYHIPLDLELLCMCLCERISDRLRSFLGSWVRLNGYKCVVHYRNNCIYSAEVIDGGEQVGHMLVRLISSIANTMTDQGPTNPAFNRQLDILRSEMLPKGLDNWSTLTD